jgi:hypothetical protein
MAKNQVQGLLELLPIRGEPFNFAQDRLVKPLARGIK